ncbi:MAG TPA: hypothetical protein VK694_06020 [Verrucomicrobiae bacterium]|nr:hypothetical protein [Verrucomicrobiae bacterium]
MRWHIVNSVYLRPLGPDRNTSGFGPRPEGPGINIDLELLNIPDRDPRERLRERLAKIGFTNASDYWSSFDS